MKCIYKYLELDTKTLFAIIVAANLLMIWFSRKVLINEIVFYNTFSDRLTYDKAQSIFDSLHKIAWVGYILSPLLLFLKFTMLSTAFFIGGHLFGIPDSLKFQSIFQIIVAAEIIFVIASLIKIIWFCFFAGNYDLNDMNFFYPLSIINIFKTKEVEQIWILPLQSANLFQIVYMLFIAYGFEKKSNLTNRQSEKIVLFSYLPALILWITLMMYLTIDNNL